VRPELTSGAALFQLAEAAFGRCLMTHAEGRSRGYPCSRAPERFRPVPQNGPVVASVQWAVHISRFL